MRRAAQVSVVARLVGVQRAVQNNGNVKGEPKYLACEESQYVLSTVEVFLVLLARVANVKNQPPDFEQLILCA